MVEQIPNYIHVTDVSDLLQKQGYWGSCMLLTLSGSYAVFSSVSHRPPTFLLSIDNVAYDPFIRNISGVDALTLQFGDWFTYDRTPRAQIFARDAPKVTEYVRNEARRHGRYTIFSVTFSFTFIFLSLDGMKRLMRYNDYTHDPLSTQLNTCA